MKYFLFISFNSGLCHNALYDSLLAVHESLNQLVDEESLDRRYEEIPEEADLEKHFAFSDDFAGYLSNETWFHIQETSDENIRRTLGKELVS